MNKNPSAAADLSRRFWFLHHKQPADLPAMAELHGRLAQTIARRDEAEAAKALDALLANIESFTSASVELDLREMPHLG